MESPENEEVKEDEPDLEDEFPVNTTDIETGIFNFVITLCNLYEGQGMARNEAREYVAKYLEGLTRGLRMTSQTKEE